MRSLRRLGEVEVRQVEAERLFELLPLDANLNDRGIEFRFNHNDLGFQALAIVEMDDEVRRIEQLARHGQHVSVLADDDPSPEVVEPRRSRRRRTT